MPKIEPGSTLTLLVAVENVWPDGQITFRVGDYPALIIIPPDTATIVHVEKPARSKRLRDWLD